ncbi:unnamed protein product [Prorocentrum cordatum]|uniref:Uncharacterized protein n=1 Tax=Prorocentrum cordatum TaxID=2364126 RepID=A0ABN9SWK5_9DINO|nr:unnamed protein product [Polarella glacialis]
MSTAFGPLLALGFLVLAVASAMWGSLALRMQIKVELFVLRLLCWLQPNLNYGVDAAKAVRLANQDLQQKKSKFTKLEDQLCKVRAALEHCRQVVRLAEVRKIAADEEASQFNEDAWAEKKKIEQKQAELDARAAQEARGRAHVPGPAQGTPPAAAGAAAAPASPEGAGGHGAAHDGPLVPGLTPAGMVDFGWVEQNLHTLEEHDLARLEGRSAASSEQWRNVLQWAKSQKADIPMDFDDEVSDAGIGVSDVGELRGLRKRAAEHGLGPEGSRKYGELLQAHRDLQRSFGQHAPTERRRAREKREKIKV